MQRFLFLANYCQDEAASLFTCLAEHDYNNAMCGDELRAMLLCEKNVLVSITSRFVSRLLRYPCTWIVNTYFAEVTVSKREQNREFRQRRCRRSDKKQIAATASHSHVQARSSGSEK